MLDNRSGSENLQLNVSVVPTEIVAMEVEWCDATNLTLEEQTLEDYNLFYNFLVCGILLNVIGVLGVIGNTISMIILSRPQMKSSINQLLIGLARCDISLILTSMFLYGLPSIHTATGYLFWYYYYLMPILAPFVYPVALISQTVSVYLTLIVTLERYVAVCHPLRARSLCTLGRARTYMGFVIVFSIVYNITRFFEVDYGQCRHNTFSYNVTCYHVRPSALRIDPTYIKIYIHWMYLFFMYFLPFGCLAVFNTAIYKQVRKANRERQRLSRLQKKEIGLATMLLCVVIVFLICNLLPLASNLLEASWGRTNDFMVETGNLMVTINSSVNFIIYVIFGEKFKRLFFKIFFPNGFRFCGTAYGGRESPDHTRDDSFVSSNGDRFYSIRHHLHRVNTAYNKRDKGRNNRRQARKESSAQARRVISPAPCSYHPARDSRASFETTDTTNI